MTPSKFIQLRNELNGVIDKEEDFVCIIKLMNDNVFGEEVLGNKKKDSGENLILQQRDFPVVLKEWQGNRMKGKHKNYQADLSVKAGKC